MRSLPDLRKSLGRFLLLAPFELGLTAPAIRTSPSLGYSTDLVFHCKNLAIVPAKTVGPREFALYIPPWRTEFSEDTW